MTKSQRRVAAIHSEIDSAQDRLLAQARAILEQPIELVEPTETEIAERLSRLGFTSTATVKRINDKKAIVERHQAVAVRSRAEAELIEYYKTTYPFLKFLTESELERICEKYSLIHAGVDRYKGDVPLKNLKDIEDAQTLYTKDSTDRICTAIPRSYSEKDMRSILRAMGKKDATFTESECKQWIALSDMYAPERWSLFGADPHMFFFIVGRRLGMDYPFIDSISHVDRKGLFIAAPKHEFDLKGLKKMGRGFMSIQLVKVKDPIVFRYVRGGVQVLTKWGLEANDQALTNPIEN